MILGMFLLFIFQWALFCFQSSLAKDSRHIKYVSRYLSLHVYMNQVDL